MRRLAICLAGLAAVHCLCGCFSERSFPIRPDRVKIVAPAEKATNMRAWLRDVHPRLANMLPEKREQVLLTEDLSVAPGVPLDLARFYGREFEAQHKLLNNFYGLMYTAQSSGAEPTIERGAPPWPGFEDIWIPIDDRLQLSARIGFARENGRIVDADCIVIMPGLLGDLAVERSKQIALALRNRGIHVLALELRGYGQTEAKFPDVPYHFGVAESGDLLVVADWLQSLPHVRRTGLIGFCWGANHALLAAWEDGRVALDPAVDDDVHPYVLERSGKRHWEAGVIAFSPCLAFERNIEQTERDWAFTDNPVLTTLQDGVRFRKNWKRYPDRDGRLRTMIEYEFADWNEVVEGVVARSLQYLRFTPHRGKPAGRKLASMRVPVLIVHGRDDPLVDAQEVADALCGVHNPNVAALVLPSGGHVGFAAYATDYFYSLVLSFFDPRSGAASATVQK